MLEACVVAALYGIIQKLLTAKLQHQMTSSASLAESLILRTKIKHRRLFVLTAMCAIYCVYVSWCLKDINILELLHHNASTKFIAAFIASLTYYIALVVDRVGNISTLTKSRFLEKYGRSYALYLRGFVKDDYSSLSALKNHKKVAGFSEYEFVRAVSKILPVCAVGMTKEVDAPYGAMRVYVGDRTWKSDVKELMERANRIFILVNSRQSCIWEMEQANEMLCKTTFIVDDLVEYSKTQTIMSVSGVERLPDVKFAKGHSIGIVTFKKGKVAVTTLGNTRNDYVAIAKMNSPRLGCLFYVAAGVVRILILLRWFLILACAISVSWLCITFLRDLHS